MSVLSAHVLATPMKKGKFWKEGRAFLTVKFLAQKKNIKHARCMALLHGFFGIFWG